MRITNGVMVDNMMRHLQDNTEKLDKLNQKLSSGKKFQLPSEDPAGATSSMDLEGILSGDDQHLRNINQAKNWLQSSEDALANGSKLLHRGRELAVKGANDSLSKTDRQ
ncbi:MAG: flagellar hook-associated protein 3, partial [Bacillota bacterium]